MRNLDGRKTPWYERATSGKSSRVRGKNVVIAVDASWSMSKHGKWEATGIAVRKLLDTLAPEDRFTLFQWSNESPEEDEGVLVQTAPKKLASLELLAASQDNVRIAKNWIKKMDHNFGYGPGPAFLGLSLAAGFGIFPKDVREKWGTESLTVPTPTQDCIRDEDFCGGTVLLITDAEVGDLFANRGNKDKAASLQALFPERWGVTLSAYVIAPATKNVIGSWKSFKQLSENHGGYPVLIDYTKNDMASTSDMASTILGYQKMDERKLVQQEKVANVVKWVRYYDPLTGRQRLSACTKIFSSGPYVEEEATFRELKHYAVFCLDAALVLRESFEERLRCLPFLREEIKARARAEQRITAPCPAYEFREERCAANSMTGRGALYNETLNKETFLWPSGNPMKRIGKNAKAFKISGESFEDLSNRTKYLRSCTEAGKCTNATASTDGSGEDLFKMPLNALGQEDGCATTSTTTTPTRTTTMSTTRGSAHGEKMLPSSRDVAPSVPQDAPPGGVDNESSCDCCVVLMLIAAALLVILAAALWLHLKRAPEDTSGT
ncbi:unnamed protein product [Amoebophrya sp. A120]|nr:unnamed protein product [Amoebophrya sp. A120]|eukprot:GSA120T00006215001.1